MDRNSLKRILDCFIVCFLGFSIMHMSGYYHNEIEKAYIDFENDAIFNPGDVIHIRPYTYSNRFIEDRAKKNEVWILQEDTSIVRLS